MGTVCARSLLLCGPSQTHMHYNCIPCTHHTHTHTQIIQLEALQDSIPELDETFSITLLPPIEFGRLANNNTVATVTIESNQDPYGVFELSVVGGATSVEEDAVIVDFTLSRTFGTFGEVAVTMETVNGTAVFSSGM